jgi:pyruvate kinase
MTIAFRDSDISSVFADAASMGLAVAVVIDGVVGIGFIDESDTILVTDGNRGGVIGPVTTITVQTTAFSAGSLQADKSISFAGNSYTIRSALREGDTGLTRLQIGSV